MDSTWTQHTPHTFHLDSRYSTWAPHGLHINSRSTTLGVQVKSTWKWYYHWIGFWKIFNVSFLALDTNTFWPYICSWSWSICHIYLPVFLPCEIRPRQHNGSLPKVLGPPFENLSHCVTLIWQVWQHLITVKIVTLNHKMSHFWHLSYPQQQGLVVWLWNFLNTA